MVESQFLYWKRQLDGAPVVIELPTDRPRSTVQTFRQAKEPLELSLTVTEALKALSQREKVTLFATLLAAFKALLHRYSGQDDILVGSSLVNGDHVEDEALPVPGAENVALRSDLSGNPSWRELLGRVQEMISGALAYRGLPLDKMQEILQPGSAPGHVSLFQVLFVFQSGPVSDNREIENGTAKFDLRPSIADTGQGLRGALEYNADLFDAATIARMVEHYQTLLAGIAVNPRQRLSDLPFLTDAERRRVLVEWNNTRTVYPRDECIHQLFETQAARTPDAVAVLLADRHLTYWELNQRANQLAHHLQGWGVGPEALVGVCVERSLEMVVGLLGILKTSGAYVPLDPEYPLERLAFMLADARVAVLLTQERLLERLPEHGAGVVCLDRDWPVVAQESMANPGNRVGADNLAYVMYTSGSTGRPKGVCVAHRGVVRLVKETNYAALTADEVFLQFAPVSFDASTLEFWGSLLNGARLVVFPPSTLSLEELGKTLQQHRITTLWLTAGLFHLMVDERFEDLRHLRQLLAGGDVLSPAHVQKVLRELRECRMINGYGPTENTTFTCCYPMTSGSRIGASVPIGRPIANTRVYVLDAHLHPAPVGVPGELCIAGDGLARIYLNRPELTAEQFVPNSFGEEPGERLYKTGDLVRYLPEGDIAFLGRIDHQVKVRGFRVEPGEIEAVLQQHPAVQESVVLAQEDKPGVKRLVAYVVAGKEWASKILELRRFLQEKLPDYMIPSVFVFLDALPLTPNGKVDRRALPALTQTWAELDSAYVAPRTPVEDYLTAIWGKVLGFAQVGIHHDFFELGGHSLAAIQVVAHVREAFQVELPISLIFNAPTVAELSESIEAAVRARGAVIGERLQEACPSAMDYQPIQRGPRDGELPLALSQEQIWFIKQLHPEIMSYNFQATLRLSGRLNAPALEHSLNEIVRRHEIYRTTFPASNGRPVQVIHRPWQVSLPVEDLQSVPEDEREAELQRWLGEELGRPFDITRLPLLRWTLLRLSEEEHVLVHVEHHLIHDGWSFNVFLHELLELYQAFCKGQPSPLPDLPIQFVDFAHWQQQWVQSEAASGQLAYWRAKLTGSLPLLELPTDRPRPAVASFRGAAPRIELPVDLCEALRAFSRREGVTLFMTMLGAYLTLLHRYTGQEDINVGSGVANHNRRELEVLIGMLINVVVLRNDLSGDPTFRELLQRVREVTLEAYAHQELPFEKIVEVLQPERNLSYNPLFQVAFSFHDAPLPNLELAGLSIEVVEGLSNESAKFDLNIIAIPRSEQRVGQRHRDGAAGITIIWEYSTDLFDAATIERMIGHYQTILKSIVADPNRRLSDVLLLTEAERQQLLAEWSVSEASYPRDRCIQELFEAQVTRLPDSVALVFEDQHVTYRELSHRANRLAHYLQMSGVGRETLVGICIGRSLEMIVGILGVLKAGGAYVPLDPTYPQERLAFILDDAQPLALLTWERLAPKLPEHEACVVCLDTDWDVIAKESGASPASKVSPDNLAYVIYTSGSTGKPKGVTITHANICPLLYWGYENLGLTAADRTIQYLSYCFDWSVWEIFITLTSGAALLMVSSETVLDPRLTLDFVTHRGVTVLHGTPTQFQYLVASGQGLETLKYACIGAETLPFDLAMRCQDLLDDNCHIFNMYGPTEAAIITTTLEMDRSDISKHQGLSSVSIGGPVANARCYIVDRHNNLQPVGIPGELYIAGDGLARDYLNRPDLTAEKFAPDPFGVEPGARLYRTGDLVRYLLDGSIEFLGRADYQVKIRGFRIELGEIEAVLSQHPMVQETVVLAREDSPGDKRLVAYVVPNRGQEPTASELHYFMKEKVPPYMVPSAFVMLAALPLTPNGKVDRRALPIPERSNLKTEITFVAPRSLAEEVVAATWAQVLELERVSVYDNFFALGGHSLMATRVLSRLCDAFQIEISLRDFFEAPTAADLALVIENMLIEGLDALTEDEAQRLAEQQQKVDYG